MKFVSPKLYKTCVYVENYLQKRSRMLMNNWNEYWKFGLQTRFYNYNDNPKLLKYYIHNIKEESVLYIWEGQIQQK
jgi:hypothetical protein